MKKSIVVFLHVSFWSMCLFIVFMVVMALNAGNPNISIGSFYSPLSIGAILPGIFGFYTFYLVLFEKFLAKKKFLKLFLFGAIISLFSSAITEIVLFIVFNGERVNWTLETVITSGLFLSFIAFTYGIGGLVMKGFITWYNDIKLKADLNKKNYEIELALVKSQINPHFLFNTINNIDILIEKDSKLASVYLNKLSDIMRFMLYETVEEKIQLNKELSYIEKFIELQKLRTTNENYINYIVNGDPSNYMIAPILFIPFIENAFKHAENKKIDNAISIIIDIEKTKLIFTCENAYNPNSKQKQDFGGLGSELIKKRLNLLYPEKHSLTITKNSELYKVELILNLNEN